MGSDICFLITVDALELLTEYGYLQIVEEQTGGRPLVWYIVNPRVRSH